MEKHVAFGVKPGFKINPSLNVIYEELSRSYELEDDVKESFDFTLESWARQGVLLLNTALTVVKGHPNTHKQYWDFFTVEMMHQLAEHPDKENLVFMLWGKAAQTAFEPVARQAMLFQGKEHKVIKAPHPAAEVYGGGGAGFIGSNCFIKCNSYLEQYTEPINFI